MVESLPILHSSTGRDGRERHYARPGVWSQTTGTGVAGGRTSCVVRRRSATDIAPANVAHYRAAHGLGRLAVRRYLEAAALGQERPCTLCLVL